MAKSLVKKRADYRPPEYVISETELEFTLDSKNTRVHSRLSVTRNDSSATKIRLDGEGLLLDSVSLDGVELRENLDYSLTESELIIEADKDSFLLEISNSINPKANTLLEGLYYVQNTFCTQCEAEGFRRITYYLDRPDVLSVFTVTVHADEGLNPFILSNGNKISSSTRDGIKSVTWHDPHPKPSYLFALVAGNFDLLCDSYTTKEGREVSLELYVEKGRKHQGQFALDSLKRAMKWDEDTFNLSYDLDIYMIVAVDFFNMGAMENKGLNVFNSKFVLAEAKTATDEDYFNIESIIAHEYFHNWTGNRVTCRDWFQLSLKEGLTVFRDQKFSADMSSELSTRINQVKVIKEHQFAEDAGPMSHPIRPDEVVEMNNFYTVTVYDKGAEVIRMMHTLLGENGFKQGMALYFARHDGQAVTCDDFVQAMQDASGIDLTHFRRWYSQSGTPRIKVSKLEKNDTSVFVFKQVNQATADQQTKQNLYVPVIVSALNDNGETITFDGSHSKNLVVDKDEVSLSINATNVVPILHDNFSSPAIVEYEYTNDELLHNLINARSNYAKWDASQRLYKNLILADYNQEENEKSRSESIKALAEFFKNTSVTNDVFAELLSLPSFESVSIGLSDIAPLELQNAIKSIRAELANHVGDYALQKLSECTVKEPYAYDQSQVHKRLAAKMCMLFATIGSSSKDKAKEFILQSFYDADNMTVKLNCLKVAQLTDAEIFDKLMSSFEQAFKDDSIVMDKWFALQATAEREDILSHLALLQAHSAYNDKNPNKIRSIFGSFGFFNISGFHMDSGLGYKTLADKIIEVDKVNPQVASRLITPLLQFKRYKAENSEKMKMQIERIFNSKGLSKDLFEKTSKALTK